MKSLFSMRIPFAFLSVLIFCSTRVPAQELNLVRIGDGQVQGTTSRDGKTHMFRGIPFAAPPVGELRWKAPQRVKPWAGILKCDRFGPSPEQGFPSPFLMYTREFLIPTNLPISEDCLYLNVWSESLKPAARKPVMVWIYGGAFRSGGSAAPIYDGEALAKKGIVFVSFNYRVGIFGFFAHPELSRESSSHTSGNYGFLDQVAALKWVKKNIAAFGGDPDNITIAGQSAGSISVNCLVASPLTKGLVQKAIAESGANMMKANPLQFSTLAVAEKKGIELAQSLHAGNLAVLRKIPAGELLKKGIFQPVIDGYFLPQDVVTLFEQKKQADIPLLTGWDEGDGIIFPTVGRNSFIAAARLKYGAGAARFFKFYPASTDAESTLSQAALSRDRFFAVNNRKFAAVEGSGKYPSYVYYFRHVPPGAEFAKYGAFHTVEVPYFLGNLNYFNRNFLPADRNLSAAMLAYYVNFIKSGNPNGAGLPVWPAYSPATDRAMIFQDKALAGKLPDAAALDFLASHP